VNVTLQKVPRTSRRYEHWFTPHEEGPLAIYDIDSDVLQGQVLAYHPGTSRTKVAGEYRLKVPFTSDRILQPKPNVEQFKKNAERVLETLARDVLMVQEAAAVDPKGWKTAAHQYRQSRKARRQDKGSYGHMRSFVNNHGVDYWVAADLAMSEPPTPRKKAKKNPKRISVRKLVNQAMK
jgi:hypothetical protein